MVQGLIGSKWRNKYNKMYCTINGFEYTHLIDHVLYYYLDSEGKVVPMKCDRTEFLKEHERVDIWPTNLKPPLMTRDL